MHVDAREVGDARACMCVRVCVPELWGGGGLSDGAARSTSMHSRPCTPVHVDYVDYVSSRLCTSVHVDYVGN